MENPFIFFKLDENDVMEYIQWHEEDNDVILMEEEKEEVIEQLKNADYSYISDMVGQLMFDYIEKVRRKYA